MLSLLTLWAFLVPSHGQEVDLAKATLDFQLVLVAPVESIGPYDPRERASPAAGEFPDAVLGALGDSAIPLRVDDVAQFGRDADLSARDYLRSCPDGRYLDCAFVIGQRAPADYVVTAIRPANGGLDDAEIAILDIPSASVRLVLPVDLARPDLGTYVADLLASVVRGDVEPVDIRLVADDDVAPEGRSPEAVQAAQEEVAAMRQETIERGERTRGRTRRLTRADLEPYRGQDHGSPWEQRDLSADSWRRWKNSGRPLAWWRAKSQGRQGELHLGITLLGLAQGPWRQRYEAWYSIDPNTLRREDTWVLQDQQAGLARSWEAQLGIGLLPWLDLAAYGGPKTHPFQYRVQRIVPGNDPVIQPVSDRPVTTWHVGGRATLAPFPTFPVRPTLGLGAEMWWARDRAAVLDVPNGIPELPPNRMVFGMIHPGVEADLGPFIRVFARMDLGIPLSNRGAQTYLSGGDNLPSDRPGASSAGGLSIGGSLGAVARLRLVGKRWPKPTGR